MQTPATPDQETRRERNIRLAQRMLDRGERCLDDLDTIEDPDRRVHAYEAVSRAIRRNIALVEALDRPRALEPALPDPAPRRVAARVRIIRGVEDAIATGARDRVHARTLTNELLDRLEDPELEGEIDTRPPEDILADILRDLRLATPFAGKRRTPADIATLRARAAGRPVPDLPEPEPEPKPEPEPQPLPAPTQARPKPDRPDYPVYDRSMDPDGVLAGILRSARKQSGG